MKREEMGKRAQKARTAFLTRGLLPFAFVFAFAHHLPSLSAEGGKPGGVFDFGAGARPLAMGGSYSALAKDSSAVYYNPAGLGLMNGRNLSLMHAALYEGASYDYFSYAQNFGKLPGAWGGELIRLNVGGIDGRDELNQRTSDISYTETGLAFGGGLSGVFYPGLSAGLSAKVLNRSLAGESDNLIGFDAGLHYGPFYGERLNLSLVAQNLAAFAAGGTSDRLPFSAKAGASYIIAGNLLLSADVSSDRVVRVGTEYVLGPAAVRAGYGAGAVSFGAGLKFLKAYSFDVAMMKNADLGVSNRFSMNYLFGGAGQQPRAKIYAKDYLAQAKQELKDASWLKAHNSIAMGIGIDTGLKKGLWGERHLRLGKLIKGLRLSEMPDREGGFKGSAPAAEEAARAAREYVEGQTVKSMLLAHSASGYEPNNAFYQDLLRVLSTLNSREISKEEILPRKLLIQEKLNKAAAMFYERRFESAMRQCEEALMLDDANALAWTRLGSVYYAMGDREKARKAYEKGVQLDPSDQQTVEFMKMQGWK